MDNRRDELRATALRSLREHEVLMLDGHFDYGNGFHGPVYLNPHRIFRQPSLIWRLAQDLIAVLPDPIVASTEVVAGPVMGGALLAHTLAGLLDARRDLTHPATQFAPLSSDGKRHTVRSAYLAVVKGRNVLLADDVRNTGQTFARAKAAIEEAGGTVIGSVQIVDRLEATVEIGVPNFALTVPRARESSRRELPPVQGRHARHQVLASASSKASAGRAVGAPLQTALQRLYTSFDHPESALDPIQIVRRYAAVDDREIVAFVAAGLAFGRVASVMASVEAMCQRLGSSPATFVRAFDPARDTPAFAPIVHRWTRGADLAAVLWILKTLVLRHGSLERAFARGLDTGAADVEAALEAFSAEARAVDLRPIYGRVKRNPGAHYFFSRPSTGSACKRLNLFLRWMIRQDGVDPGGWTLVPRRQLIVPLDTHTIRAGKCLRLTTRASPGWKMAAEITGALRAIDSDDPVRYDFSLCHLSMMGACGYQTKRGSLDCPLKGVCRPW